MTNFTGSLADLKAIIEPLYSNGFWIENLSCCTLLAGWRCPLLECYPKTGKIQIHVRDRTDYEFAIFAHRALRDFARSKKGRSAKPKPKRPSKKSSRGKTLRRP